jgi:hypothetical protein
LRHKTVLRIAFLIVSFKVAHRIRIITVPEIMAGQVQWPGRLERPRTRSVPPPPEARSGETLHLPFAPRDLQVRKAKVRSPGTAKIEPGKTRQVAEKGSRSAKKK